MHMRVIYFLPEAIYWQILLLQAKLAAFQPSPNHFRTDFLRQSMRGQDLCLPHIVRFSYIWTCPSSLPQSKQKLLIF